MVNAEETYLTQYIDYTNIGETYGTSVYVYFFNDVGTVGDAWPGAAATNTGTDYIVSIQFPTSATAFILNNASEQTSNITTVSTVTNDTFIFDSDGSKGTWVGTTWTLRTSTDSWAIQNTTEGGSSLTATMASNDRFRLYLGTGSEDTDVWTSYYDITSTLSLNVGEETNKSFVEQFPYFTTNTSNADIYVATGYDGIFTFTFGSGLYIALRTGADVSSLLTIERVGTSTKTINYYPVINGNICDADSVTASETAVMSSVAPNSVYGYKFTGWYWKSDLSSPVSSDDTAADVSLYYIYAAFELDSGTYTFVDYTFDYSSFYTRAAASSDYLFVHYIGDGVETTYPGINLGALSTTGIMSAKIPSTATTVVLAFYNHNTDGYPTDQHNQTINITITPTAETDYDKEIFLTGICNLIDGDSNYGRYYAYTADAGYAAIKNALSGLAAGCLSTYRNNATDEVDGAISTVWTTLANTDSGHKEAMGTVLADDLDTLSTSSLARCMSRYDYIVSKYGTHLGEETYNPLARTVTSSSAVNFLGTEDTVPYVAVFSIVGISVLALGAFLIIKKRKESSISE